MDLVAKAVWKEASSNERSIVNIAFHLQFSRCLLALTKFIAAHLYVHHDTPNEDRATSGDRLKNWSPAEFCMYVLDSSESVDASLMGPPQGAISGSQKFGWPGETTDPGVTWFELCLINFQGNVCRTSTAKALYKGLHRRCFIMFWKTTSLCFLKMILLSRLIISAHTSCQASCL